ncbi:MAG: hypothetical protein JXR78_09135 [Victivallales bacterium]|nr:hypothetical protein [Victivallales bacterium]
MRFAKNLVFVLCCVVSTVVCGKGIIECDFSGTRENFTFKGAKGRIFVQQPNSVTVENRALRVIQEPEAKGGRVGGMLINPENVSNSWAAMFDNGSLNGACDFFFSSGNTFTKDTPHSIFRPIDHDNRANGGLRFAFQNISDQLCLEIIAPPKGIILPNGKEVNHLGIRGAADMVAGQTYHLAISFITGDDGFITVSIYRKAGTGIIDITKDKAIASGRFKLNMDIVKKGFTSEAFRFGKLSSNPGIKVQQFFSRFSLYDYIPDTFPALGFEFSIPEHAAMPPKHNGTDVKPSILFVGSDGGHCGNLMAKILNEAGFNVNSYSRTESFVFKPLSWDEAKNYNILVITGLGESNADGSITKKNSESVAVLRRFLESGGGVLCIGNFGQRQTEISPQELFLKGIGLQPLWLEMPVDKKSVKATPWQVDFAYTENIEAGPLTKGVKGIWFPFPSTRIGDQHHSIAFKTDNNWNIAVSGSDDSQTTYQIKGSHTSDSKAKADPTWETKVPLAAYRQLGKGRVVFFSPCYQYVQSNTAFKDMQRIMLEKGLSNRLSDGLKFIINSLKWLAEPSLESKQLGGAANNPSLLVDPDKIVYGKSYNWDNPREIAGRNFDMPGLVGARSNFSSGKGSPEEWVAAAKKHGLRFIVFLEEYTHLTEETFAKLKSECTRLSDENFTAFPGFTIDDEIGNHYFYFSSVIPLPEEELIDKNLKVFTSYDPALGGHIKGQLNMTSLRYAIGKCIGKFSGGNYLFNKDAAPFADWFGNWNTMGVVTSRNGELEEFAMEDYFAVIKSGQGPTPVAITFVDSPDKIASVKWKTVYKSRNNNNSELNSFFNDRKFFPDNPCSTYITSGPEIRDWSFIGSRDYEGNTKGDFEWRNYRWILRGKVASEVGLKEVIVRNGPDVFRRFKVNGEKEFRFSMDLNHDKQKYLLLEVVDLNGNRALSREMWDRNHRLQEFMCADRNNQLGYSLTVNSEGNRVKVGNNLSMATPHKRVHSGSFGLSPNGLFRAVTGFDGGIATSFGSEFMGTPVFKLKNGETITLPRVIQSFRKLHSFDVSIGSGKMQYEFSDNIKIANVWHTLWKVNPTEYVDVDYERTYFQLDPDQPTAIQLLSMTFTLKKDMPNNGLFIDRHLRPNNAKLYSARSSDGRFWAGGWDESGERDKSVPFKFQPGSYIAAFESLTGGNAAYPLSDGMDGILRLNDKNSFFSVKLTEDKTPQKKGESVQLSVLYAGIPNTNIHDQYNNSFFEELYHQFGLDGGKGAYSLELSSGKVLSQRFILEVDGGKERCLAGKISGKLITRLPVKIINGNSNWSAFLFDSKENAARPLGVVDKTIWASLLVTGQNFFIGHPVTADNEELHIQLTQTGDDSWNLEIHNPTDSEISADIKLSHHFPPFNNMKQPNKVTLKAGSSVHLKLKN